MIKENSIELRAVEPEDLDLLYRWENDNSNWLVSQTLNPFSKATLKKYIDSIHDIYNDKQLRLVIMHDDSPIGLLDLFEYDAINQRVGIGILIDQKQRRNGYGVQSVKMACDYCFSILNVHQVYCNILSNNKKSIELFEKVGFHTSGNLKSWIKEKDVFLDQIIYQKFKD